MVVIKNIDVKQKGASLLWVMVFAGVISLIVTNMLTLIIAETKYAAYSDLSFKAYVAAQSGVEATMFKLREEISTRGIFALRNREYPFPSLNHTISSADRSGLDNVRFDTEVSFNWDNATEPVIKVISTGTAERDGKLSRRKLVYVNDYSASVGAENFEVPGTNYAQVVNKLKGALRATLLIENAKGYPQFHITLLPNIRESSDNIENKFKVYVGKNSGSEKRIGYQGFNLFNSDGSYKKTRWRIDYMGVAGAYISLEEREDIGFEGRKFSQWKCVHGNLFEYPYNIATLSEIRLRSGDGTGKNSPIWRRNILNVGEDNWHRTKESYSNNWYLYNSSQGAAIDNVVAIRY